MYYLVLYVLFKNGDGNDEFMRNLFYGKDIGKQISDLLLKSIQFKCEKVENISAFSKQITNKEKLKAHAHGVYSIPLFNKNSAKEKQRYFKTVNDEVLLIFKNVQKREKNKKYGKFGIEYSFSWKNEKKEKGNLY